MLQRGGDGEADTDGAVHLVCDACYHPAKRGKLLCFDQRILGLAQTPQRSLSCVASIMNLTLGALALDELTDLAADGSQR